MFDPPFTACPDEGGEGDLARAISDLAPAHVEAVSQLVRSLVADPRSRTAYELTDAMRALDRLHAVVDHLTSETWSAWEDTMSFVDDGYRSPGAWINANLCVRGGVARYQVGLARKLRSGFPCVREAAATGRLGRVKVELLVKARAEDVAEVFDAEEAELVAGVECRTVEAADAFLASWRLEVLERLRKNDKDSPPPPEHEASTLQLSPILDERMLLRGELNANDSAIVRKAIDDRIDQWFAAGLIKNDTRSRQELQAAALVELVKDGTMPANRGKGARPLVMALIDADTLTARAAAGYRSWLDHLGGLDGWPLGHPRPGDPPGGPTGSWSPGSPDRRRGDRRSGGRPSGWQPGTTTRSGRGARVRGSTGPGRGTARPGGRARTPDRKGSIAPPHWRGGPPTSTGASEGSVDATPEFDFGTGSPPRAEHGHGSPPPTFSGSDPRSTGELSGSGRRSGRSDDPERAGATDQMADRPPSDTSPGTDRARSLVEECRSRLDALARFAAGSPRVAERMPFRSELVGAGPVDPSIIEMLMCSGDLMPVLHRHHSEILDVGRAHRLATPVQRRALVVRSGGTCEWPGCSVPHNWCDAHHLHFWEEDGPTDMANLALVCTHHHKRFHHGGYTGVVTPDGLDVRRPDGSPIQPTLSGRW